MLPTMFSLRQCHGFKRLFSSGAKPFEKVMIANRGEIAQRVMRTCGELDINTVAIYSTADAGAPFVQQADEAWCVGPASASQSYLNSENIEKAITQSGAQAVHPGYGFMSENAEFAALVQSMGVAWLGPSPQAVQDMGDKLRSKELAQAAGVTVVPGYEGILTSEQQALQISNEIGYPVLLKAAAGGGGKGMRVCFTDGDVKEAYPLATQEAKKFFKDDRLLVEKYIENPHHIEFQVLSGRNASTDELEVCVFAERECSIQRRNQKIIEESPSCLLEPETREKMVQQVKELVHQVGYESAGTVEFLVDEDQNFYFLEMNTRLQVEHPVTELVSGVDLVKGMLWVGAGWGLPQEFDTSQIMPHNGHAMEARIYAEDPLRGFLPSTGPLIPYQEPTTGVRVDSGVAPGHVVSPHYDPMLSKVVCWGESRPEAIAKLTRALDEYVIEGVQHNAKLCNSVLRHDAFIKGDTPTSFLPTHFPHGWHGVELQPDEKLQAAAAISEIAKVRGLNGNILRLNGMFGSAYKVTSDSDEVTVQNLNDSAEECTYKIEDVKYEPTNLLAHVTLDNDEEPCIVQVLGQNEWGLVKMQFMGAELEVMAQTEREYELSKYMHPPKEVDLQNVVKSPMPGTLISLAISEGDAVEEGQELCVVEAMKMQNVIKSPRIGIVDNVQVTEGASLMADQVILNLVPEEKEEAAA